MSDAPAGRRFVTFVRGSDGRIVQAIMQSDRLGEDETRTADLLQQFVKGDGDVVFLGDIAFEVV